jgi:2-dehydro-3-deoxygluconokinase
MPELMRYTDICICNGADAEKMLGLKSGNIDLSMGAVQPEAYLDIYKQMLEKYPFKYIASSLRESISASDNSLSGILYSGREFCRSRKYQIRIVDRVGGGDAFTAGIIDGILEGKSLKAALEFAVAASALKHTVPGDANLVSRAEVEALLGGDGTGRIQR